MTPEQVLSSTATAVSVSPMATVRSARFGIAISRALGTDVVTVHGELDATGARHLGSVLADIIDGQGNLGVVVDLHDASAADASGLSVLAAVADKASHRGAELRLSDPPVPLFQDLVRMGLGPLVLSTLDDGRHPSPSPSFGRVTPPEWAIHPAGQSRSRNPR